MKRHISLETFSRDHNNGLILARHLEVEQDKQAALQQLVLGWDQELCDHFDEEERLLLPLCTRELGAHLLRDHEAIRAQIELARQGQLVDEQAELLGQTLHDHIRWEEREFFPAIEASASEIQLLSLLTYADEIEAKRAPQSPRRAELVGKRYEQRPKLFAIDSAYAQRVAQGGGVQWGFQSEDLNGNLVSWSKGQGVAPHVNSEVDVLLMVVSGNGAVIIDDHEIAVGPGQCLLLPKSARRSILAASDGFSYFTVHQRRKPLSPI